MTLNHIFNIQSFNSYCLVLANKFKREFVLKISSLICYFLMKYSKFLFGFFSVFRTFLFSTNSFLEYFTSLQRVFQEFGFSTSSPVDITEKLFIPKSTPIVIDSEYTCLTGSFFHLPLKCLL